MHQSNPSSGSACQTKAKARIKNHQGKTKTVDIQEGANEKGLFAIDSFVAAIDTFTVHDANGHVALKYSVEPNAGTSDVIVAVEEVSTNSDADIGMLSPAFVSTAMEHRLVNTLSLDGEQLTWDFEGYIESNNASSLHRRQRRCATRCSFHRAKCSKRGRTQNQFDSSLVQTAACLLRRGPAAGQTRPNRANSPKQTPHIKETCPQIEICLPSIRLKSRRH